MKKIILFLLISSICTHSMEKKEKLTLYVGACSVKGDKETQDDRFIFKINSIPDYGNVSYSGVFDGHGLNKLDKHGYDVSLMLQREFFEKFTEYIQNNHVINEEAFKYATAACEQKTWELPIMYTIGKRDKAEWQDNPVACMSGSTLLVSCFEHKTKKLHSAWVGDSRGLLGNEKEVVFFTKDHVPTDPEEKKFIESFDGYVNKKRVCGNLAMSRAIGDIYFKKCFGKGPVNATPDYKVTQITTHEEYYIEATDGFWDVVKNEEVPTLIQDSLFLSYENFIKKYPTFFYLYNYKNTSNIIDNLKNILKGTFTNIADKIAVRLIYIAMINRGSMDDTTVIVTLFDWNNEFNK